MARLLQTLRRVFVPLLIAIPSTASLAGYARASERLLDPRGAIGSPEPRSTLAAGCARINVCRTPGRALNGEAWAGGNQVWQTELTTNTLQLFDLGTCPRDDRAEVSVCASLDAGCGLRQPCCGDLRCLNVAGTFCDGGRCACSP